MDISSASLDISGVVVEEPAPEKTNGKYDCMFCHYTTQDKSNFNRHSLRHASSQRCSSPQTETVTTKMCNSCGRYFQTSFGLRLHIMNIHLKQFKQTCLICDKGFNQTVQFRAHSSGHMKVDHEKCIFCKKTFSAAGSLRRHLLVCESCPRQNDETPSHICDVCGMSYPTRDRLTYHKKGKHHPPNYLCEECGKRFSWRSSLAYHKSKKHP